MVLCVGCLTRSAVVEDFGWVETITCRTCGHVAESPTPAEREKVLRQWETLVQDTGGEG